MDCYFHQPFRPSPSAATVASRSARPAATKQGLCPSCRLDRESVARSGRPGIIGRSVPRIRRPPQSRRRSASTAARQARATAPCDLSVESRALVALGYPLWPLAPLSLLDRKQSPEVRRQASRRSASTSARRALVFTLGRSSHSRCLDFSALPTSAPAAFPLCFVASVVFGVRAWHGDDVHVPVISDWLDVRQPAPRPARVR